MIETILVVFGWVAVACWVVSSLWRVCVDGHRRGSNPRPPGGAPPPPPGPPGPVRPQPSLGLSMDREVASRLDDLERRVALLERLTRTLSAELNRLRHD